MNKQEERQLPDTVNNFQHQYQIKSHLILSQDIALPKTLLTQLTDKGDLLLASQNDRYILKKLDQHPSYLLQLNFPLEVDENDPLQLFINVSAILKHLLYPYFMGVSIKSPIIFTE